MTKQKLITYTMVAGIVVVALLIAIELISLVDRQNQVAVDIQPSAATLVVPASEASGESQSTPATMSDNSPPSIPRLEYEITDLMTAFGVEDKENGFVPEVYDETDVESLSLGNVNQVAPMAGTYKAINLFEQGVEKNLAALEAQGRSISITADGEGHAVINFLGLDFDATYDDHYLYLEDATKMPYYWDGQTITTAAHRIELDLVRVDSPTPAPVATPADTLTESELAGEYLTGDTQLVQQSLKIESIIFCINIYLFMAIFL